MGTIPVQVITFLAWIHGQCLPQFHGLGEGQPTQAKPMSIVPKLFPYRMLKAVFHPIPPPFALRVESKKARRILHAELGPFIIIIVPWPHQKYQPFIIIQKHVLVCKYRVDDMPNLGSVKSKVGNRNNSALSANDILYNYNNARSIYGVWVSCCASSFNSTDSFFLQKHNSPHTLWSEYLIL